MSPHWLKTGLLFAGIFALAGCAARPATTWSPVIAPEDVNASLIATGGELQELAVRRSTHPSWEDFRNDGLLVDRDMPIYGPWMYLEVRHREHLSTISGRPREFSSTVTQSIRREVSR